MTEVDISPETHIINSIMNQDMLPEIACAELADNAFDAKADFISFDFNSESRSLTVTDNGVGLSDMRSIVKLGCHDNEGRSTSGRYGVGGMDAILSFGSIVEIVSIRNNIERKILVDFDEIKRINKWKAIIPEPVLFENSKSGTIIKIKNLNKEYYKTTVLTKKLEALFAPALRSGKTISVNGSVLKALPIIAVDEQLQGEGEYYGKQFKWYAGIKPKNTAIEGGWTVSLKHRIIKEASAYGLQDYSSHRFYGMIELVENENDIKWEVTKHKNNLRELEALCEYIFDSNPEIRTLLEKVNSEDSVELESQMALEVSENLTQAFSEILNSKEKRNPKDSETDAPLTEPKKTGSRRVNVTRHQSGDRVLKGKDSFSGKKFRIEWLPDSPSFGSVQGNRTSNIVRFGKLHPFWLKHKENRMMVKMAAVSQLVLHAITTEDNDQPILACMTVSASQSIRAFDTIDKMAATIAGQEQ